MESIELIASPFTLTIDWLAFTIPHVRLQEVHHVLGGDWVQVETGFRGYPRCWLTTDGSHGLGKLGTGAPRRQQEVHGDLSAGIVAAWTLAKMKRVLQWIIDEHNGHVTRLDCALDDRKPLVPIAQIQEAYDAGQVVTRARQFKLVSASDVDTGASRGATLYFGSPTSQTLLRIYDKRLELQQKGRNNWEDYGTRWEVEFKKDRAQVLAMGLGHLEEADWLPLVISRLRAYIDFRDTSRDAEDWARCRAPLVDWWAQLTDGFRKGRLTVEQPERKIEDVLDWFSRTLGPTLAVLYAAPEGGPRWLEHVIHAGADRWTEKHRRLLKRSRIKTPYVLKPS